MKAKQFTLYLYPNATDHVYQSRQESFIGSKSEVTEWADRLILGGSCKRVQIEGMNGTIVADISAKESK